jgi:hypothetical protein
MNERILELAVQARNHALDEQRIYERMHNTEQCMEEYREVYNEKFAELIVRDCAEAALAKGRASPDTDFRTGSYVISEYLLSRYGVE